MIVKSTQEKEALIEGGKRLSRILDIICERSVKGVTTKELDTLATELIRNGGDEPSFLGYKPSGAKVGYPGSLCVSVNDEIVHGIGSKRVLREGDIIGLDIGLIHRGMYLDMARSVAIGTISYDVQSLLKVTRDALTAGIKAARIGNTIGNISAKIQSVAGSKFGIVRELGGHGVGAAVHEEPFIPNFGASGEGEKLKRGMVLALEPMFTLGSPEMYVKDDGFTYATSDMSVSAHFEHTILVTDDDPIVLTKSD